jgi:hypothetical protein
MNAARASVAALGLALWMPAAWAHGGSSGPSGFDDPDSAIEVKRATLPLRDVNAAVAAGYAEFRDAAGLACIEHGSAGAMGIHYLNGALIGTLDPLRPQAVIYEPQKDGRLELVGVEYIVFQDAWDAANAQPPALFGHPFHLVRAPNRYGVPAFYELHLWIWRHNSTGLFSDWNPAVGCR